MRYHVLLYIAVLAAFVPTPASAATVEFPVSLDRWMYPFNATPGTRSTGSTFGAFGSPAFDNRDAQVLLGFDVSSMSPLATGQFVAAAAVQVSIAAGEGFVYDPTYDGFASYIDQPDADAGRPLELFAVSTRNGFTGLTTDASATDPTLFKEQSGYSTTPGIFRESRSAFASDFAGGQPRDVSNSIDAGFDPVPFAVGTAAALTPGQTVPINTQFTFQLDLLNADVNEYVTRSVAEGEVFFAMTSLHAASREGPATFPSIYLDAGGVSLGPTPKLVLQIDQLPSRRVGDTDADGDVDIDDLNNVRNQFGTTGSPDGSLEGDAYPFDGRVNIDDLNRVRNQFGTVGQAVPEPHAAVLLAAGLVALASSVTRRRNLGA